MSIVLESGEHHFHRLQIAVNWFSTMPSSSSVTAPSSASSPASPRMTVVWPSPCGSVMWHSEIFRSTVVPSASVKVMERFAERLPIVQRQQRVTGTAIDEEAHLARFALLPFHRPFDIRQAHESPLSFKPVTYKSVGDSTFFNKCLIILSRPRLLTEQDGPYVARVSVDDDNQVAASPMDEVARTIMNAPRSRRRWSFFRNRDERRSGINTSRRGGIVSHGDRARH